MKSFDYQVPTTVEQAVALLAVDDARPLAGGTDLLVQMRYGRVGPNCLVDVKRIPELTRIEIDETGLTFGAAVTCAQLSAHPAVRECYPGLIDAVSIIGGAAIQNRATVGGNLCNGAPSADAIPALIVHRARCVIAGSQGMRTVPVETFCIAPGKTMLVSGELLVSIRVSLSVPHSGAHYVRFIPRGEMDIAVAGAGAWIALTEDLGEIAAARIALGAVAPTPLLVADAAASLIGKAPTEEAFAEAASMAQKVADPITDVRGTAAQRRHLVGVLTRRALRGAVRRASGLPLGHVQGETTYG
jgi:carbon-monoxide dehydrogenase medium subunit